MAQPLKIVIAHVLYRFTNGEIFNFPAHNPSLMTLQQLRDYAPEKKAPLAEIVDPKTGVKGLVETWNRFQPNDPSELLAQIPSHQGNSWCEQSLTCNDLLRFRAPFFFYGQRFDRLTRSQTEYLEHWQAVVRNHCDRQQAEVEGQLELCHCYDSRLHHMRPPCWQTGLTDMGQSYAYRYKDKLEEPLKALMGGSFNKEQVEEIVSLLDIPGEDYALNAIEFARICALAERLFYCQNMRIYGEEGYAVQQGILEMADFHMLVKKLEHVQLAESLQRFLQRLDLFK
ncbi:hypothetical protein ECG_03766 [Echinococcus granulosus]|nr:hypothetical protein ECG_03766 [Echinococcus granulosus]